MQGKVFNPRLFVRCFQQAVTVTYCPSRAQRSNIHVTQAVGVILSIFENEVWKYPTMTIEFTIFLLGSVRICFTYFGAPLLGAYLIIIVISS